MASHSATPVESGAEKVVRRLGPWKVAGAILGTVLASGVAFGVWRSGLATKADLAAEHDLAASERITMRLETQALRDRVTRSEADLDWIKATLFAIAQKTGATNVPPPPP